MPIIGGVKSEKPYRGRLAPSPTGYLHLGHVSTFCTAFERARANNGTLILRDEDIDLQRSKAIYGEAFLEDLEWLGLTWDEGPYKQSERIELYKNVLEGLKEKGLVYACDKSRSGEIDPSGAVNWLFRVPRGRVIAFEDGRCGPQEFALGDDFDDFIVWRKDDVPAYELAVVVDDHDMGITEVVRGEDLLASTARQLLIYEAFDWDFPEFYHCELVKDLEGKRLAKRYDSLSIQSLRAEGLSAAEVLGRAKAQI